MLAQLSRAALPQPAPHSWHRRKRLKRSLQCTAQDSAQQKVAEVKEEARGRLSEVIDKAEQKIDDDDDTSAMESLIGATRHVLRDVHAYAAHKPQTDTRWLAASTTSS